jgi:hypothetical protein
MKKIIIIFVLLTIAVLGFSETSQSLGISAGLLSAGGFSYRQFNDQIGYQINFIAVGTEEIFPIILGGKILYPFHQTNKSRIYYLAGGSFIHDIGSEKTISNLINIGAGIGFEFTIHSNLRFSFDMPIIIPDLLGEMDNDISDVINFIPDIAFHYYF